MLKNILFLGDSFCANIDLADYMDMGSQQWQGVAHGPAYPSLVARHYNLRLAGHGYGGKSWWYSRAQFMNQLARQPGLLDQIDAMVFCHTDSGRINSDNIYTSTWNQYNNRPADSYKDEEDRQVAQAQAQWFKHLSDWNFQEWAQQQWFKEISQQWSHIKQIHFHCFPDTIKYNHLLIGQRFSTSLIQISAGELTGTGPEIHHQMSHNDARDNHLSAANNHVLAQVIINALDNYEHKVQPLDLAKFNLSNTDNYRLLNPNW